MNPPFAQGRTIGGTYTLASRVGTGGMSEVWSAKNERTGAMVALKLLRASGPKTGDIPARFRHEAMVGAQLDHRNIARVYDFLEDADGTLVLVMALLRGKPLSEYLRERKPLPENEAIAIALDVLAALAHAHECGILHRDIKPENIFLAVDTDGVVTPKLLDFGIAKLPSGGVHTVDGTFLGTPQYMAPERVRDAGPIDARSDIFSVGVVLFEMLTGVSPFEKNSIQASLVAVLEEELDPDPRVSPLVWNVLRTLVAKAPGDRPNSAASVAASLRKLGDPTGFVVRWDASMVARPSLQEPAPMPSIATLNDAPLPELPLEERARPDRKRVFVLATMIVSALVIASAIVAKLVSGDGNEQAAKPLTADKRNDVTSAAPDTFQSEPHAPRVEPPSAPPSVVKLPRGPRVIGKKPDF